MRFRYIFGIFFTIFLIFVFAFYLPGLAFDTSQTLIFENSYLFSQQKMDHTLTLEFDYFHELTDNIF
ncbi:MAG: hypothetical protein ACOC80_13890, partial [Petrotogales bacterium]